MRAVLDPNVLIAAILAPSGVPADIMRSWRRGDFELIVSPMLLSELERALTYPRLASRISTDDATSFVELLRRSATVAEDSADRTRQSRDVGDDYLLALAEGRSAVLVSGDKDLLAIPDLPIDSPAEFLARLRAR